MSEDQDNLHYERTHEFLDAARTAVAGNETNKALTFLIKAVEHSTFGWGSETYEVSADPAENDDHPPPSEEGPSFPDLRTLMIQGRNCVSVLNEHAQKRGIEMPRFDIEGSGPFRCTCHFLGKAVESDQNQRTKNEAKHDAAVQMLRSFENLDDQR